MDSIDKTVRDSAYTELKVQVPNIKGTHNLKLKIDTGASGNTLPIRTYHQMFGDKPFNQVLKQVKNITLSAYNGQTIHCVGSIILRIKFQQPDFIDALFYVVNVPGPAIVGLPTCEALKLVTINCDEVTMISYHSVDDVMKHSLIPLEISRQKPSLFSNQMLNHTAIRQENAVFISSKTSGKSWRKWKNVELFDQLLNTQIGVHL